jgi:hypothetical protein
MAIASGLTNNVTPQDEERRTPRDGVFENQSTHLEIVAPEDTTVVVRSS